jgi:hypothetical protein
VCDVKLKTVAVLGAFAVTSAQTIYAPPDQGEQERVLTDSVRYALAREEGLPNFVCVQTTHHFEDIDSSGGWQPIDTIVERLTYFDHRENYEVLERNGQPVRVTHEQLRGAPSASEFGSVMRTIFLPRTQTEFAWQAWSILRGRRMHVYAYRVRALHYPYHIELPAQSLDLATAYHGLVYIDNEQHFVHRVTLQLDGIPLSFPIQDVGLVLEYDYARIDGANYLLPLQFELRSRQGSRLVKNDVDYGEYANLDATSVIKFGLPDVDK